MDDMAKTILLKNLFNIDQHESDYDWQKFSEGVEIFPVYGSDDDGPKAALLRYAPGASIPQHEHMGYEHILILSGTQSYEHGEYPAGTMMINPQGSTHSVSSKGGCIALAIWERQVAFC